MDWLDQVIAALAAFCALVAVLLLASCFTPEIVSAWRKVRGWWRW